MAVWHLQVQGSGYDGFEGPTAYELGFATGFGSWGFLFVGTVGAHPLEFTLTAVVQRHHHLSDMHHTALFALASVEGLASIAMVLGFTFVSVAFLP